MQVSSQSHILTSALQRVGKNDTLGKLRQRQRDGLECDPLGDSLTSLEIMVGKRGTARGGSTTEGLCTPAQRSWL